MFFWDNEIVLQPMPLSLSSVREQVRDFLQQNDLEMQEMDHYLGGFLHGKLVAGGGIRGNVICCVAVSEEARSHNITASLVTELKSYARSQNFENIFLFTKKQNKEIFENLAFHLVGQSSQSVLMESSRQGIASFCKNLSTFKKEGKNGCVVLNANPFTLGHRYLVEQASKGCENLYVFVVSEDKSVFKKQDRLRLVKLGVQDISNATVLEGGSYIVSQATFPSYFLKDSGVVERNHAQLDSDIFARHIAKSLGIVERFLGSEPTDKVTENYNQTLSQILPNFGIEVKIIERLKKQQAISASQVRKLFASGQMDKVAQLVPKTTFDFLNSGEAQYAVQAILQKQQVKNEC